MSTVPMIALVKDYVFPQMWELLPTEMRSPKAEAMLLAIGLQESRFLHRRQISGPARGFWQFERGGGVRGVLRHAATEAHVRNAMTRLRYDTMDEDTAYRAIEHHDVLAAVFARLLLWTLPQQLPNNGETFVSWHQYEDAWRPGRPHRETWDHFYEDAWNLVLSP